MFRRIVLVATGSGIGPCTPAILGRELPIRLLWTAPNLRETFGDKLVDSILEANPEAVIYSMSNSFSFTFLTLTTTYRYSPTWQARHGQVDVAPREGV